VDVEVMLQVVKAALGEILGLTIRREGNVIVLDGDIANRNDGLRIERQIKMNGTVILDLTNRTYYANDLEMVKKELEAGKYALETAATMNKDGEMVLMVRGTVQSEAQKTAALAVCKRFFDEELIVDQIVIVAPQVEVDVDVYTIDLTKLRSVGTNTMLNKITDTYSTGWVWQTFAGNNTITTQYPEIGSGAFEDEHINALIQDQVVSKVSRQHASVRSGSTASIEDVIEKNVQVQGSLGGTASLESVSAGRKLEITPTVQDAGKFETNVTVEMSEWLGANSLDTSKRKTNSVFVSETNERVVLGGSKLFNGGDTQQRTPFLGRIPLINLLFRASDRTFGEVLSVYTMTLRLPNTFKATDEALSVPAIGDMERAKSGVEKEEKFVDWNRDLLEDWHVRWE